MNPPRSRHIAARPRWCKVSGYQEHSNHPLRIGFLGQLGEIVGEFFWLGFIVPVEEKPAWHRRSCPVGIGKVDVEVSGPCSRILYMRPVPLGLLQQVLAVRDQAMDARLHPA